MARDAPAIWPLRHGAPAPDPLHLSPPRPDPRSRALDAARLRRAALRPATPLQARRVRARPSAHGSARGVGHRAQHRIPRGRGRRVPRLVLRHAERASRALKRPRGGARARARVARCCRRIAACALAWRCDHGAGSVRRGEA